MDAGWLKRQLTQCPLAAPALATIAAVAYADQASVWSVFLFLIALSFSFLSRSKVWLLVLIIALFTGYLHFTRSLEQSQISERYGDWWLGEAVVSEAHKYGKMVVDIRSADLQGHRVQVLNAPRGTEYSVGDVVSLEGRLLEPKQALNPDVFDQQKWLKRKGVGSVLVVSELNKSGDVDASYVFRRWAEQSRRWLADRLAMGVDPMSDSMKVIHAMTLGVRPSDSTELLDDFRQSGAIHVFAVSGLHVMMVGSMVAVLLRGLGCSRAYWIPCVILAMFFYAMVTGMRPPAMRASIMGAVLLGAWLVRRQIVLANSVAVGLVLALIWDGHMLFLPGFQLSFGVLIAISLLGGFFAKMWVWVSYTDIFLPRSLYSHWQEWSLKARRKIQSGVVVASCAWCGAAPLTVLYFRQVAPISILVSLPMVFMLYLIIVVSCLSLFLGILWDPIGKGMNQVNVQLAGITRGLAAVSAKVPGGHFKTDPWESGERVVVYALPDGGAAVYLGIGGGTMLDVGSARSFTREILPSLIKRGARIDSLILSHADSQHCGGIEGLLENFTVKQAVVPELSAVSSVYQKGIGLLVQSDCEVNTVSPNDKLKLANNAELEIMATPTKTYGLADDRGLVVRLHWRGLKVLFLNDVGYLFEQTVAEDVRDFSADIVVLGKHQRDLPLSTDFLRKTGAKLVIDSAESLQNDRRLEGSQRSYSLLENGALVLEYARGELLIKEGSLKPYPVNHFN